MMMVHSVNVYFNIYLLSNILSLFYSILYYIACDSRCSECTISSSNCTVCK